MGPRVLTSKSSRRACREVERDGKKEVPEPALAIITSILSS